MPNTAPYPTWQEYAGSAMGWGKGEEATAAWGKGWQAQAAGKGSYPGQQEQQQSGKPIKGKGCGTKGQGKHKGKGKGEGTPKGQGLCPSPADPSPKGEPKGAAKGKAKGAATGKDTPQGQGLCPSPGSPSPEAAPEGHEAADDKEKMSESKRRREARKQVWHSKDRVNILWKGKFRVPWFHRRAHRSPKECRRMSESMIPRLKEFLKSSECEYAYREAAKEITTWPTKEDFDVNRETLRKFFGRIGLDNPRIIEDADLKANHGRLLETQMWPDGPKLKDFWGDARPDFPASDSHRRVAWDLWLLDYDPDFWPTLFTGQGLPSSAGSSTDKGKGVCPGPSAGSSTDKGPSPGPSAGSSGDEEYRIPSSSWLSWHGTNIYGAVQGVCMNIMHKSEKTGGRAAPGDPEVKHPGPKAKDVEFGLETSVTRGIYSTANFVKASAYAMPHYFHGAGLWTRFVLLLRIPGHEHEVGITIKLGAKSKGLWMNKGKMEDNWPFISLLEHVEDFVKEQGWTFKEINEKGICRKCTETETSFRPKKILREYETMDFWPDEMLERRKDRLKMQDESEKTHMGETPWTNVDNMGYEVVSSRCSVVGMLVGHAATIAKAITGSRAQTGTQGVDFRFLPPLCRPDDIDDKNFMLQEKRAQKRQSEEVDWDP